MSLPKFESYDYLCTTEYPEKVYAYYAMKNGKVQKFASDKEAKAFSSFVERVWENEDEYKKQLCEYQDGQNAQFIAFQNACFEYFSDVCSREVFDLCWDFSYETHHAYGYDEVANGLYDIVDFAQKIVSRAKG